MPMQRLYYFFSHFYFQIIFVLLMMLISGCSFSPSPTEIKSAFDNATPYYDDDAIKLVVTATADLNSYHQQPNSCSLFVIQSEVRNQLDTLISDPVLLQGLFSGEQKASGILQINQYILMPGEAMSTTLPRAERAQYVAVIAGYYPSPGPDYSFVSAFPLKLIKHGWLFPDYSAEYQPQTISLKLGRLNVIQAEFKPRGEQYMLIKKAPAVFRKTQIPGNTGSITPTSFLKSINKSMPNNIDNEINKISGDTEK